VQKFTIGGLNLVKTQLLAIAKNPALATWLPLYSIGSPQLKVAVGLLWDCWDVGMLGCCWNVAAVLLRRYNDAVTTAAVQR
jgi:hypothetical protein